MQRTLVSSIMQPAGQQGRFPSDGWFLPCTRDLPPPNRIFKKIYTLGTSRGEWLRFGIKFSPRDPRSEAQSALGPSIDFLSDRNLARMLRPGTVLNISITWSGRNGESCCSTSTSKIPLKVLYI